MASAQREPASDGAVNCGRAAPGVRSPQEGQLGQGAVEHGHHSSMNTEVRVDLPLDACENVAAQLLHGSNPVPASLRAAHNRLIAIWKRECGRAHAKICPCGSMQAHFKSSERVEESPQKETRTVGTDPSPPHRRLYLSAERARKKLLQEGACAPGEVPPFRPEHFGLVTRKRSERRQRKQFLSPYGPLWCSETLDPPCEDPEDDITDSEEEDGSDSEDYDEEDLDAIADTTAEEGAAALKDYFEKHSSTLALAPTR